VAATVALGAKNRGFAFEADVVLRAVRTNLPIVHAPCRVLYPATRRTHFDSVRDPARIVWQVLRTVVSVPHHRTWRRLSRRLLMIVACTMLLCCLLHGAVRFWTALSPPDVRVEHLKREGQGLVRRVGAAMALKRQGIWEVLLSGSAATMGWDHAALLREEMLENEAVLHAELVGRVPFKPMRELIFDLAALRYRGLERSWSAARRQEIAATALAFAPDPFEDTFPTYQRFVYLNALYDIALSFEHSPLVGCTTFTVAPSRSSRGRCLRVRSTSRSMKYLTERRPCSSFERLARSRLRPWPGPAWSGW
jgi:hypothetical protein